MNTKHILIVNVKKIKLKVNLMPNFVLKHPSQPIFIGAVSAQLFIKTYFPNLHPFIVPGAIIEKAE